MNYNNESFADADNTFSQLLRGPSHTLQLDHSSLVDVLRLVAIEYAVARRDEVDVPRVSSVLNDLRSILDVPKERWPRRIQSLDESVIAALTGGYPFARSRLDRAVVSERRAVLLPAVGHVEREETKFAVSESAPGLVERRPMPTAVEIICRSSSTADLTALVLCICSEVIDARVSAEINKHAVGAFLRPFLEVVAKFDPIDTSIFLTSMSSPDFEPAHIGRFLELYAYDVLSSLHSDVQSGGGAANLVASMISGLLDIADRLLQRRILCGIARSVPTGFAIAVRQVAIQLEEQYAKDTNAAGLGRRLTREYIPHSAWTLICRALDEVWPSRNGPLSRTTSSPVCSLVCSTFDLGEVIFRDLASRHATAMAQGTSGIGNSGGSSDRLFNSEHIKTAASYRNTIWQLNRVLDGLERGGFDGEESKLQKDRLSTAGISSLDVAIEAVRDWRREIERRLSRGIYEKKQLRHSGILPRLPQMNVTIASDAREAAVLRAAKPLVDAIVKRNSRSTAG